MQSSHHHHHHSHGIVTAAAEGVQQPSNDMHAAAAAAQLDYSDVPRSIRAHYSPFDHAHTATQQQQQQHFAGDPTAHSAHAWASAATRHRDSADPSSTMIRQAGSSRGMSGAHAHPHIATGPSHPYTSQTVGYVQYSDPTRIPSSHQPIHYSETGQTAAAAYPAASQLLPPSSTRAGE
jgi:hypothetical protein